MKESNCQCSCHNDGGKYCGGTCCDAYLPPGPTTPEVSNFPRDQVFSLREGEFLCMVDGTVFGAWDTAAIAEAGMQVEQRRAISRRERKNV